jgi:uncharacterized membrane protein YphA (DoxX/SURF4 family)
MSNSVLMLLGRILIAIVFIPAGLSNFGDGPARRHAPGLGGCDF